MDNATIKVTRPLSCGIQIPAYPGTPAEIDAVDNQIKKSNLTEAVSKVKTVEE